MKKLIWLLLVLIFIGGIVLYAYAQSDYRAKRLTVSGRGAMIDGRGGLPLYWDGFIQGSYSGTAHDVIHYNYTGSGHNLIEMEVAGVDMFVVDATGQLTLGGLNWDSGNVIYVPLGADIQDYIDDATAGDTLVLASGVYTITTTLTVDKQLNIRGQGSSGFVTTPITPSHGTLITSTTAGMLAFTIANDNVRLANLSINLTGAGSTAISVSNNLEGICLKGMDVIVNAAGANQGFTIKGSDVVLRDLTFYITSTSSTASGVYFWNDSVTTRDAVVDAYNVTGTVGGASGYAYAFAVLNSNDANSLTLNLSATVARALPGTALDVAIASTSITTMNSIVNCYLTTLDGADYDAYQTGTNVLALGGSVIVNNKISGTITYRATMTSGKVTTPMLIISPTADQVIDNAADAILANASIVFLNPDGDYTLTSTPTIADGTKGQILHIMCNNNEANGVTVQDQGTLPLSNLQLGAAGRAISGKDVLSLIFDGTDWVEQSFANN